MEDRTWLQQMTGTSWPVIGMVHLRPLPGSPGDEGDFAATLEAATADARALAKGGAHAVMVENYGDVPFFPGRVPAVTVAAMTRAVLAVRRAVPLPVGVNVLRNDGQSALAIAHAVGASFVRVNVLSGAMVTDQGVLEGRAHHLLRERRALGADVRILGDVCVKHAAPLAPIPVGTVAADTAERGGADGLLVSGTRTGDAPDPAKVREARAAVARSVPVLLGSGLSPRTAATLVPVADGAVVGTWVKRGGVVTAPVDAERVREVVGRVNAAVAKGA